MANVPIKKTVAVKKGQSKRASIGATEKADSQRSRSTQTTCGEASLGSGPFGRRPVITDVGPHEVTPLIHAHPHNRPHRVDSSTGEFLYTLYGLLFAAKVELRIKQRTFETAADSRNSWRVVSVSEAALEHIRKTGEAKGLQRGHMLPRSSRAQYLFSQENPLTQDELLRYFFEHDTVALVTKAENSKDGTGHWSPLHAVPEGLFTAGSFSIYVRKGKEIPWVASFGSPGQPSLQKL